MIKIEANVIVNRELWNYHVTKDGRVFSLNYHKTGEVKELKPYVSKRGYNMVWLCRNGTRKIVRLSRLVALAYIPNPNNKPEVDHINRIRTDDRVENLRWASRTEQNLNREVPKNNKKSKPVRCIETGVVYPSAREIERQLGFANGHISDCCRGKYKYAYGFHWEYVE